MVTTLKRKFATFARRWHCRPLAVLLGVMCMSGSVSGGGEGAVSKEYQLKAAFLFNFTKFVEGPAKSFKTDDAIVIGTFGRNPFGAELENAVRDRKINGRAIVVQPVQTAEAAKSVHLLFVSASEDARLDELKDLFSSAGILAVGESDAFVAHGGAIRFAVESDKLRFEIDMNAADQAGLKVSAQLQKLARSVHRRPVTRK